MKKFQIFFQNHGLTPLEKCKFFVFVKFIYNVTKPLFSGAFAKNEKTKTMD